MTDPVRPLGVAKSWDAASASKGSLARWNISTAAVQQAIGLVGTVIRIPLVLHALGAAPFGLWTAVLGVASLSTITDFGLQAAVIQRVAELRGRKAFDEIPIVVATGFWLSVLFFAVAS